MRIFTFTLILPLKGEEFVWYAPWALRPEPCAVVFELQPWFEKVHLPIFPGSFGPNI